MLPVATSITIDLHGYYPDQVVGYPLENLIRQAYEIGVDRLRLVHGRGVGLLGQRIRHDLSHPRRDVRQYMGSTLIDNRDPVLTVVSIRKNAKPTRDELDLSVLPATRERRRYEADWAWTDHRRMSA
jgi:hypothetical protein